MKVHQVKILSCIAAFLIGTSIGACIIFFIAQHQLNNAMATQETVLKATQDYTRQFVADSFAITPAIKDYVLEAGSIQVFSSKGPALMPLSSDPSGDSSRSGDRLNADSTYTVRYYFPDELRDSLKNNHLVRITAKYSPQATSSNNAKIIIEVTDLIDGTIYSSTHGVYSTQSIRLAHVFDTSEVYPQLTGDYFSLAFSTSTSTDESPASFQNIIYSNPYTYYLTTYSIDE